MSQELFDRFLPELTALTPAEIKRPEVAIAAFIDDARKDADRAEARWRPTQPGAAAMESVEALYPRSKLLLLRDRLTLLAWAEGRIVLTEEARSTLPTLKKRARDQRREIAAACGVILDDDIDEPADATLAALRERARDRSGATFIAINLQGWVGLARTLSDRLALLKDFDPTLPDQAEATARELLRLAPAESPEDDAPDEGPPPPPPAPNPFPHPRDARNAIFTLAFRDHRTLRRWLRYVFRNEP